ncbi:hypothetical protein FQN54_001142 [Arachnomyces sp. PD_36]|nr:hypothetical protein FQN54_001142 [Arachnomyces sp. PD_36]
MDPFERLPVELIREIIQDIPDFVSLENLLSASPRVNSVYEIEPRKFVEGLILSNSIASVPDIQLIFRNIALINSPSFHCISLDDYTHQTSRDIPALLPEDLGNTEISQVIHIAARVQRLACACLLTMRRNFVAAIEASPDISVPAPTRVQRASEPFSWIEEYRVYWSIWHLHLYSELRKAAGGKHEFLHDSEKAPGGRWNWSAESIGELDAYPLWNKIHEFLVEQLLIIAAILDDLGLKPSYGRSGQEQVESTRAAFYSGSPMPFFSSFELPEGAGNHPIWSPPPMPEETPAEVAWRRTSRFCNNESPQTTLFRSFGLRLTRARPPVLEMIEIQPFRRMGVLLWDKWRMHSVGLMPITLLERIPTPDGGFVEDAPRGNIEDFQSRWLALVGKELKARG